ncbi:MAG: Na-K-Cl cotransporter [Deltaproteobacteria bacterium]|nr:MAG: Na-K-Cl cotransporter [Deltaproteobacteria bacterium]
MKIADDEKKLGTFLGVYTPTILTILGVIMYLRSGWLVGHLGLTQVIVIVLLANSITLITALAFSSVATNIKVGTGGAYYIISRSLGLEIGGAVGVPLFLSQAFSVTLYSYGLAESLRLFWPEVPVQSASFVIIIAVGVLALMGAGLALRTQIPIMVCIAVSLVALTFGAISQATGNVFPVIIPSGEVAFWAGFAIFFPAVTGVMAGLGLSGDLRQPERAIPLGAISAVLTAFAIYLIIPVLLARGASVTQLREDSLVWIHIAPFGNWVVLPGLLGAIFSSAVASMLGAPRTLQALAKDRLAPRGFGRVTGDRKEFLPGLAVSLAIALGAVFLGDLNAVASVVTIFFLTIYGTVNIVAAFETLSGDPSWRPKLRVPWPISLMGGGACLAVMFLINPIAGFVAVSAELMIWIFLSRREHQARWGDVRRGLYEALIRWALIRLAHRPMSARNWRPHVLAFVPDPVTHLDLIRFGNWFSQGRGVVTVCELVIDDLLNEDLDLMARRGKMQEELDREELVVFAEQNVVQDVVEGITNVAQANGIGAMESNTVMLGWPKDEGLLAEFLRVMRRLECLKKSLIIGRIQPRHLFRRTGIERKIHVWWGGMQRNGDLMLLLAYLLTRNHEWRGAQIEVLSLASNELMKVQTERHLNRLIPEIRIEARPRVIIKPEDKSVRELIHEESKDAEVIFFGLAMPDKGDEEEYARRLKELAGDLPTVFFVKNSSLFIGELLEQSTGEEIDSKDRPEHLEE